MNIILLASYAILWAVVIMETLAILALARQIGILHTRIGPTGARMSNPGLELGTVAPTFNEHDLNGRPVTLGSERGRPTMLVFISPSCPSCRDLIPALRSVHYHEKKHVDIIAVSIAGDESKNQEYASLHGMDSVHYIISPALASMYEVPVTPYAVLVDSEGKVYTKGLVNQIEHLESLLNALDEGHPSHDDKMNTIIALKGNLG